MRYGSKCLKNYFKQLNRLVIEDEILYRLFLNDVAKKEFEQCCLPKHLWKETLYRIQNSQIALKLQEFRRRFFPWIYKTSY